jgi:hypothetical protein
MNTIVTTFDGKDLVISRERIEQLGIKPGEQVQITPVLFLYPVKLSPEERERRLQLAGPAMG